MAEFEPAPGPVRVPVKSKVSPWNDPQVRGRVFQSLLLLAVVWCGWYFYDNTTSNLERQNIASGFSFLDSTAGFGIIFHLIEYSETSTYGAALLVGLLNTLLIAFLGCILATIVGVAVGQSGDSPSG